MRAINSIMPLIGSKTQANNSITPLIG